MLLSKSIVYVLDHKIATNLHLVKIVFDTPTFDLITKDEKANMETKLSTIGGTMGLFTGFSIISGIEIIYFACKIVINMARRVMDHSAMNVKII